MTIQRLFALSPTAVFTAQVNQASFTYPLGSVEYDNATGDYTDVLPGMTVLFGSLAGLDDLGRQRVRLAPDVDTLYIGRSSRGVRDGEVDLTDGAYITVLGDDYRMWAKIPAMDGANIYKDHDVAFTDQTEKPPPKANIAGGWVADKVDETETLTVTFDGSDSYPVAEGATLVTRSWDVGDGTVTAGAGTDTLTATFPAGHRWVSHTVIDSNDKTHTMRVLVYAHDEPLSECVPAQCVEHRITKDGQFCSFRSMGDLDIDDYPDGTMVIFWEGGMADPTDRSNVLFWGWHQTSQNTTTAERTGTLKDAVLQCLDGAGRLDTLPAFPQSITRKAVPTNWLEMTGLNMDLYIDYLFRWHSTAFELLYYTPSGTGGDYPMVVIGSDGESLLDQCQRRAAALVPDYMLTCNRRGELRTPVNPILQDTGDRTAVNQATLTSANWTAVSWQRIRPPRWHWNRGEAIVANASDITAVFCDAPGVAPGQGLSEQTSGEQLTISQDSLNAAEGHRYAYINAFNGQVAIRLGNDPGINPAAFTWMTLTVDDIFTRRLLGFTAARGLPIEVNISYNYQNTGTTKTVEVLWEEETSGTPAVTYIPPEPDWEPPYIPPIDPPDIPPPPTGQGDGLGTNYVMDKVYLIRTRDLSAASPTWAILRTASSEDFYDFILDPWSPKTTGLQIKSSGVDISDTLLNTTPTWTNVLTAAEIGTLISVNGAIEGHYQIKGSIRQQGFFAFIVGDVNGHTDYTAWCVVTGDYGANWNAYQIYQKTGSQCQIYGKVAGGFEVSPHLSGSSHVLYAGLGQDNVTEGIRTRVMRSIDSGQTWAQVSAEGFTGSAGAADGKILDIHVPYNDNADSSIVLLSAGIQSGPYFISTNSAANFTKVTAVTNTVRFNRTPFQSWTQDRQELYAFGGINSDNEFWRSSNAGTSWIKVAGPSGAFGNAFGAGGFPYNESQFYVIDDSGDKIWLTLDGGTNWIDKTGNAMSLITAFTYLSNSGGVIVPVWTEE